MTLLSQISLGCQLYHSFIYHKKITRIATLKCTLQHSRISTLEHQRSNTDTCTELSLGSFGMAFSNRIYSGNFRVGTKSVQYSSGTSIARFPKEGRLLFAESLMDETESGRSSVRTPPILSPISRKPHNNKKGTRSTSS